MLEVEIIFVAIVAIVTVVYWYRNRNKSLKYLADEIRYELYIQAAGAGGLLDDLVGLWWNRVKIPDANNKIAVITGGARGIGTEVIRGLLQANMIVIMGIRKPEQVEKLKETMKNSENLHAFQLDLRSLKSVKQFADNVLKTYPVIHVLVNNAGIMFGDFQLTEDGIETQLAVNYIGHFYLTHLLLPALKKGGTSERSARVVNVTSCAHYFSKIDFEDINMKTEYHTTAAYSQSKLAQLMTARYLDRLLSDQGCNVKCYSVHPGIVDTDLFEDTLFRKLFPWAMKIFFKTPSQGATSILHACFFERLEEKGGLYISNCKAGLSSTYSLTDKHQQRLFEVSCALTNIDPPNYGKEL